MAEASVWLAGEDGVAYIAVRKDGVSIRMDREEADKVARGLAAAVALDVEGEEYERLMGNG